ncbi:MAG: hypothetical protein AAF567_14745 [Actinomycetota bacterium]
MADGTASDATELSTDELFERIDVLPPYYALREVTVDATGLVHAIAPIQQPLGAEIPPLSAAEAGRHLAICGSVAASLANPKAGRFHYLATDAEFRRGRSPADPSITEIAIAARATMIDKRTAHASVFASTLGGKPLVSLSCYYSVVGYDMMRKMFSDHCLDFAVPAENPYAQSREPERVEIAGGKIEVDLGRVEAEACAGHFEGLPAMPVAYLMSNVAEAAGSLIRRQRADPDLRIAVQEGSVRADGLAFAGESVVLRGEHQGLRYGNEWVYVEAFTDTNKRVGALHLKATAEETADES